MADRARWHVVLLAVLWLALHTATAQAATVPGKFGRAVNIRATPLRVGALKEYRGRPLTVELWARLADEKKTRYNVLASHLPESSPDHWEIYTTPLDGLLSVRLGGKQGEDDPTRLPTFIRVTDDKWHYIAVVFGRQEVTVHIDGKQVARHAVTPTPTDAAADDAGGELFIGTEFDREFAATQPGLVDELRISGVARDVKTVPTEPFAVDEHTVGLWHFDETAGNTHRDETELGNQLAYSPGVESAWTPRSATRADAPDWEKATDDDWHDGRFNLMDTGGRLGCSMAVPPMPGQKRGAYAAKGIAIRLGDEGEAGMLFDTARLQMAAGWAGGWVTIPDRRFGLIEHPWLAGEPIFSVPSAPGVRHPRGSSTEPESRWSPLPREWGEYLGYYLHGDQTVLHYTISGTAVYEMPGIEHIDDATVLTRTIEIAPDQRELVFNVLTGPKLAVSGNLGFSQGEGEEGFYGVALTQHPAPCKLSVGRDVFITVPPHDDWITFRLCYLRAPSRVALYRLRNQLGKEDPPSLGELTHGGPARWTEPITTTGTLGEADGKPFAVDTLTLPHENPYGSIFYVTGVAFLPDGRLAVCTIYGDVWLVSGVDDDLDKLTWKRFASGLYQPMGLVLKDGKLLVLERGQITRLHDRNGDDEADYYENYYHRWQTPGDGHAYDVGLKLAPDGSLFFLKGQTSRPAECAESGCLVRIAPDARSHEVYATGFRHPIGLGIGPHGEVTGADQQGNWMPATRIDRYTRGGFYGDMRTHHRKTPPEIYDPPICWLPRDVDNSAGGQVWVPEGQWGPLAGKTLHLSWGRCWLFHLLHESIDGKWQGGVIRLPGVEFLSGPITGGFRPEDGHLYVVGLHGWQTAGAADGCLQRVRRTNRPLHLPLELHARPDGLEIRFSEPLDPATACDVSNWTIERWSYRWSAAYGSDHWSVADPDRQGHDRVPVEKVTLSDDGRTVVLSIPAIRPVMQMKSAYRLKAADGTPVEGVIHHTIHSLPRP